MTNSRQNHQIIANIDVPNWPLQPVAFKGLLYVSSKMANTVTVIDPRENKAVRIIEVGHGHKEPVAIGVRLWVANDGSNTVSVIEPEGEDRIVATCDVGERPTHCKFEAMPAFGSWPWRFVIVKKKVFVANLLEKKMREFDLSEFE